MLIFYHPSYLLHFAYTIDGEANNTIIAIHTSWRRYITQIIVSGYISYQLFQEGESIIRISHFFALANGTGQTRAPCGANYL